MRFEWDVKKSDENERVHGIGFDEAKALWDDPDAAEFHARRIGERRRMLVARYGGSLWTAIFTYRGDDEEIARIISVRRSSERERRAYEQR